MYPHFFLMKMANIAMIYFITIIHSMFLRKRQFHFAVATILPPVMVYGIYLYISKNSLRKYLYTHIYIFVLIKLKDLCLLEANNLLLGVTDI